MLWSVIYNNAFRFTGNDVLAASLIYWIINITCNLGTNYSLYILEPHLIRFRIDPNNAPKDSLVRKELLRQTIANILIFPILIYYSFSWFIPHGYIISNAKIPNICSFVCVHLFSVISQDFSFYWGHRILHTPYLYRKFHKKHHEFNHTRGVATLHATITENIFSNLLPTFIGPMFWAFAFDGIHIAALCWWVGFKIVAAIENHSGFYWPISTTWLYPTEWNDLGEGVYLKHHYFHHSHNQGNYSSATMDWLFGTDQAYREYVQKRRLEKSKSGKQN